MAGFSAIDRVLVETDSTNVNKEITRVLRDLDSKAKTLREAGKLPLHELADEISMFEAAVTRLNFETVAAINTEIGELRSEWEKNRDRHADQDLAKINRASNRIGALSDDQCVTLGNAYLEDGSLNEYEINALSARFRQAGLDVDLDALHRASSYYHGTEPWLQTPEAGELIAYRDRLAGLKGGETFFEDKAEDVYIPMPVKDLIDYNGELGD